MNVSTVLRESGESLYQALFEIAEDAMIVCSAQGGAVDCNQAALDLFACSREQMIGSLPVDWSPEYQPDGRRSDEAARAILAEVRTHGKTRFEWMNFRADGRPLPVEVTIRKLQVDGHTMFLVISRDISERKRAQQNILLERDFSHAALDSLPGLFYLIEQNGRLLRWNKNFEQVSGLRPSEIVKMSPLNFFGEADKGLIAGAIAQVFEHGSAFVEAEFVAKDGTVTPHLFSGTRCLLEGKLCLIGMGIDISARKKAEAALHASQDRFRKIVEQSPLSMALIEFDGTLAYINRKAIETFGYHMSDIPNMERWWPQAYPDETSRLEIKAMWKCLTRDALENNHEIERREYSITCKDGQVKRAAIFGVWVGNQLLIMFEDVTERRQVQEALKKSEEKFSLAFSSSPEAIAIVTLDDGKYIEVNDVFLATTGYGREEVIGHTSTELGLWIEQGRDKFVAALHQDGSIKNLEIQCRMKSGAVRIFNISSEFIELEGLTCTLNFIRDITDAKRSQTDLRIAATAFEAQEGMVITDADETILRVNRAFVDITGYSAEEAVGKTPRLLSSGRQGPAFYAAMKESIRRTGAWKGEIWNRRKNSEIFPEWLAITAVKDELGRITNYVATLTDITQRKNAENEINSLAFYDPLTKLPNRRLLLDRLKQCQASSTRSEKYGAVLLIDIDRFKTLNDTHGHDVGDLLLQQIAKRLCTCVRDSDTVARLGGDEFVVMLENLSANQQEAAGMTEAVTKKILSEMQDVFRIGTIEHRSSASIGATLFLGNQASIDDLLKQADLAMYKAKEKGRNTLRFFDPVMQTIVRERAALENGLRAAIEGNQLILHYQAQVDGSDSVTGVEVLVRWHHPQRGMIQPMDFIPLAEETGLILPLGQWVLETACAQLAVWAGRPEMAHLTIAVNVSAKQIREPDFVDSLLALVARSGANPGKLKLELTESVLVDNVEDIIEKMSALKARGVGFSLDDFGTGYSSLSYLKRLPLDQLKIDRSFVRDVLLDPNDAAIARTIVALAETLGLSVIAEGVETELQKNFLVRQGCHAYQGYLFSRPLPLDEFEKFVRGG